MTLQNQRRQETHRRRGRFFPRQQGKGGGLGGGLDGGDDGGSDGDDSPLVSKTQTKPVVEPTSDLETSTSRVVVPPTTTAKTLAPPTVTSTPSIPPLPSSTTRSVPPVAPIVTSSSTSTRSTTPSALPSTKPSPSSISRPSSITSTPLKTQTSSFHSVPHASITAASAGSSATSSTVAVPGLSTGTLVGAIGGGIIALSAITFIAIYFLRRWRRKAADEDEFKAAAFRRSAVLLDDNSTPDRSVNRGYNPRPPSMIERHLANNSPAPFTQYAAGGGAYGQQPPQQYSFSPGEIIPPTHGHVLPPPAANPFLPSVTAGMVGAAGYGQRQPPYPAAYSNQFTGQPPNTTAPTSVNANTAYLNRQPSSHLTRQPSAPFSAQVQAHYVDMSRSANAPVNTTTPNNAVGPTVELPEKKRPDTVYTVYNPDDAYGGI